MEWGTQNELEEAGKACQGKTLHLNLNICKWVTAIFGLSKTIRCHLNRINTNGDRIRKVIF
jgi:hypothetical protein